jgi:prepilin peptidase CpaA
VTDYRTGHIPNWLTFGALVVAPIAHASIAYAHAGGNAALVAAAYSIVGAIVCALVPLLLYRLGAMGGGDVKLLAALGALLTPMLGLEAELYGFIAAMLIAPARLIYEGKFLKMLGNTARLVANPFLPKAKRKEVPQEAMSWYRLGPAIFLGTLGAVVANWSGR